MDIFMADFPASASFACGTPPPALATEPVATVVGLGYDSSSDTYSFVWKTDKAWTECRVLQLNFADGSSARAVFDFGDPSLTTLHGKRR